MTLENDGVVADEAGAAGEEAEADAAAGPAGSQGTMRMVSFFLCFVSKYGRNMFHFYHRCIYK